MRSNKAYGYLFVALSLCAVVSCEPKGSQNESAKEESSKASDLDKIAKLDGKVTFTLEDGEALNRENPETFWIPDGKLRENLVEGDLVKLVFNLSDGKQAQRERMWVLIKSCDDSGYTGVLDNDPYSTDEIKAGLEVVFEPRHVIDIYGSSIPEDEDSEVRDQDEALTPPN